MKQQLWSFITISLILFTSACSKSKMVMVLDDICRDTYEKNLRKQRIENLGNPAYEEPLTYDQYQKQRKELVTESEATTSATEMEPHYNIRTPITLPIESIRSNESLINQSFSKSKIDLLEKILNDIMIETHSKGISVSVGVPDKGIWSAVRGITGNTEKEKITPNLIVQEFSFFLCGFPAGFKIKLMIAIR